MARHQPVRHLHRLAHGPRRARPVRGSRRHPRVVLRRGRRATGFGRGSPSASGWPPSSPSATPPTTWAMDDDLWDRLHAALQRRRAGRPGLCVASWLALGRFNQVFDIDGACRVPAPPLPEPGGPADGEGDLPAAGATPAPRPATTCGTRLLGETVPRLLASGVRGLAVNVHDCRGGRRSLAGSAARRARRPMWPRCRSGWTATRQRGGVEAALADTRSGLAGYLVVESLYDDYGTTPHGRPRDWPDGERSPGVLTVALIHRPDGSRLPRVDHAAGTAPSRPVSAELQPRTRYVRNEVVRPVSEGAPDDRRHRRGGLAVGRARGRPAALLQRHHRRGAECQRGPDDGQRRGLPRSRPACAARP